MTNKVNFSVLDIEIMSEDQAFELAEDTTIIKGHDVYFVNFDNAFGFSCLVYADGKQIRWANDYELHHNGKTPEELKKMYVDRLNDMLYTVEELKKPIADYFDYERRRKYITELYPLRRDHQSCFAILHNDEEEKAYDEESKKYPYFCPIAFARFNDKKFVDSINTMYENLKQLRVESEKNYEYMKTAFYYELGNHEYHINTYQGDWDTLSAFGNIEWHGQGAEARELYYKELDFSDIQIKAFEDARKQFLADAIKNDWY